MKSDSNLSIPMEKLKCPTNKQKQILYGIAMVLWMVVIFYFSSQNAVKSSGSSSMTTRFILDILSNAGILSTANITPQDFLRIEGMIRTAAHFSEYLVFGWITFQFFRHMRMHPMGTACQSRVVWPNKPWQNVLYPLAFCLFYALTDEIHQYFIPGRAMQLEDWLVDAAGALCSILLMTWIVKSKKIKGMRMQ